MPNRARAVSQVTREGTTSFRLVRSNDSITRSRPERDHTNRLTLVTASIAHEVNQPLSGIMTNASTCLRMLSGDSLNLQDARDSVLRILRDVNRAAEVIGRLRALFAESAPASESVDVNELLHETVALAQPELSAARVTVAYALEKQTPRITGDRVQLQQVVLNLVRNACDAMSRAADRARTLTIATMRDGNGRLCVSVRDLGVGFDAEQQHKLFTPFYTTKAHGMGIGLSVSRSIIENHRGRLWASPNRDGPGATFWFAIPCAPQVSSQHPEGEVTRLAQGGAMLIAIDA